jgi:hypothetical protein
MSSEIAWRPAGLDDVPGERSRPAELQVVGAPRLLDWGEAEEAEFQRRLERVRRWPRGRPWREPDTRGGRSWCARCARWNGKSGIWRNNCKCWSGD